MGYRLHLVCTMKTPSGKDYKVSYSLDANTTCNLRDMIIASTGLEEWSNSGVKIKAKKLLLGFTDGLRELLINGDKYKQYEAKNGWGTIIGCSKFFEDTMREVREFVHDQEYYNGNEIDLDEWEIEVC